MSSFAASPSATSATSATSTTRPTSSSKTLRIGLWTAQAVLAAVFLMAGFMKVTWSVADLSKMMSAPAVLGEGTIRFIGVSEIAGAFGLVLPALTRIKPVLTPVAAAALGLVMVLGAGYHMGQGELDHTPTNLVLGALAAFVAWGRLRAAPIAPRA